MGLKVWGSDPASQPKARQSFADDVVGRFRAGYVLNNRPASLDEWRVTTGDPEVAEKIHELLGGRAPQTWESKGEDNIEVFTASADVDIIIERPTSLRQRLVLWSRNGKVVYATDGEWKLDEKGRPTDEPDPDASLSFAERKAKAKEGTGPEPDIDLFFRLADEPDLGIFRFKSTSWSLVSDLAYNDVEAKIAQAIEESEGRGAYATLRIKPESFVAKNGPRAGQTVTFNKTVIEDIQAVA